jgi:hypothetical protein
MTAAGSAGWAGWVGSWVRGAVLAAGLVACSNGDGKFAGPGTGGAGTQGGAPDAAAPSAKTDTDPGNPHVTTMPPISPNGPTVTVPPGSSGASTGAAGATGTSGTSGSAGNAGTGGATTTAGTAGTTGTAGASGGAGTIGVAGTSGTAGAGGTGGAPPAAMTRNWPTVDCVGGPCAAPNVCVNLDFLFVACVACGGDDQVCCPPYVDGDPWLGTCDPGLVCAHNPNFQSLPPKDVVEKVCQIPGMPPTSTGGLNHQRLGVAP